MSLYRRTVTALAVLATVALGLSVSWLTLTPQDLPKVDTLPVDKLAHVAAFAALILPSAILRPRFLWWTFPLAALLGFSMSSFSLMWADHRNGWTWSLIVLVCLW